jgi:hypothetical protein
LRVQATKPRARFDVTADGDGLVGHAGAALLAELAGRRGLPAEVDRWAGRPSPTPTAGACRSSSPTSPILTWPGWRCATATTPGSRTASGPPRPPGCGSCRSTGGGATPSGSSWCCWHWISSPGPRPCWGTATSPWPNPRPCAIGGGMWPVGSAGTPAGSGCGGSAAGPGGRPGPRLHPPVRPAAAPLTPAPHRPFTTRPGRSACRARRAPPKWSYRSRSAYLSPTAAPNATGGHFRAGPEPTANSLPAS